MSISFLNKNRFFLLSAVLCAGLWGQSHAVVTSLDIVFNGSNRNFEVGVATNDVGNGQIHFLLGPNADGGEVVTLQLISGGQVIAGAMDRSSFTGTATVFTHGRPNATPPTPIPITFLYASTAAVIRATLVQGTTTLTADSPTFNVSPGAPARYVLLPPGTANTPLTGRTGTQTVQPARTNFIVTVLLTDQYYNPVGAGDLQVDLVPDTLMTVTPNPGNLSAGTADFQVFINASKVVKTLTVTSTTSVTSDTISIETSGPPAEEIFPFPSPFNPKIGQEITFQFAMLAAGDATLKVTDQFGQLAWEKSLSVSAQVLNSVNWNGRNEKGDIVAAGIYYILLEKDGSLKSKKRFGVVK